MGAKKPKLIFKRLFALARATQGRLFLAVAGFAKDFLGQYEEAAAWQRRSIEANGNYPISHFHLAAALSHLGRREKREPPLRLGSPSILNSRLRIFARSNSAKVRCISLGAHVSSTA